MRHLVTLVMPVSGFIQEMGPLLWIPQSPVLSSFLVFLSCSLSPIVHPVNASGEIFEVFLKLILILSQILGHSDFPLGMRSEGGEFQPRIKPGFLHFPQALGHVMS